MARRAPQPGDRVIVRRHIPDTPGHLTDVIGHVVSLDPLVVRPQSVGGFPSEAEAVTIPDELIQVCKVLPPRRVRNSDIRAVETATAAAFPGIEHRWCGQWLLRAGDGITERSNSAAPLGRSAGLSEVPLAEIEAFYVEHDLPVRVLIPDRIGNPARTVCAGPAWRTGPDIVVMTRPLRDLPALVLPNGVSYRVDNQPDEEWLALYHFRGRPLPEHALNLLRTRIDGRMGFGRLLDATGRTLAITRGTITASGDGRTWLGYSAVEVVTDHRRRGLGTHLGTAMLHWGARHGADMAYLQVLAANKAGIGLYDKLGFIEHHRHRYAELDPRFTPGR
ncbi:GNAT family N-acetyltransferase [Corynebacterium sp. P5848]|uniref:N-acetylglutamate synthase, CG3035 family n=1 Tax=Corynebacterium marambiense TaxID=2765364 RepID=UPI002260E8D4|nr:GNAT family N-acetyltransferase [Corynebacterium marambiense]MCX7543066.1 GNAT family N-acetyltransferase [Corynebacterium marambiense]